MTKRNKEIFRKYVRGLLQTALKSKDKPARMSAVRQLCALVLAQEYADAA